MEIELTRGEVISIFWTAYREARKEKSELEAITLAAKSTADIATDTAKQYFGNERAYLKGLLELVAGLHRTLAPTDPDGFTELQDRLDQCKVVANRGKEGMGAG